MVISFRINHCCVGMAVIKIKFFNKKERAKL